MVALGVVAALAALAGVLVGGLTGSGRGHDARRTAALAVASTARDPLAAAVISHPGWRPHLGPVPVLMYHLIQSDYAGIPDRDLYVGARTFHRQMEFLRRHGFQAVTLSQVEDAWSHRGTLPRRPIVLTFDDGYRSQYKAAFPLLRRMRWPGVLDLAGLNLQWSGGLSPAMVKRMIAAGWELASHTISHVNLTAASPSRLRYEVAVSRRLYRRWFHVPVHNFCYPSGSYDRRVQAAVKRAGYRGALAVSPGLARRSQRYALNRIRVYRGDRLSDLAGKLRPLGA
jgi:peptidoglycan/xylan/chitin deacetylase (PgdA/CDA1 family)